MTQNASGIMALEGHRMRQRLGRFLDARYRDGHRTKRLARDARTDPRTARNWLQGCWPSTAEAWAGLLTHFGDDLVTAVFTPDADEALATLRAEEARLAQALETVRASLDAAEGRGRGDRPPAATAGASASQAAASARRR